MRAFYGIVSIYADNLDNPVIGRDGKVLVEEIIKPMSRLESF